MSCAYTKVPMEHLYRKNESLNGKQCVWKYKWLKSPLGKGVVHNEINQSDVILRPRLPSLWYNIQRSKWYRRGWVLQERILSRRMIYYTKEKLYWDCLEWSEDEEGAGSHGGSWRSGLRCEGSACQVMGFWWDLVYEYSQCVLTYRHDKLAAIAGLCGQVENRLNQKCYAGIFADNAGLNLLWLAKTASLMRHPDFHAPSWSWAAYEGVITFNSNDPWEGKSENLISSINFETRNLCPASEPHLHSGRCISGTVSFTAPLGKLFRGQQLKDISTEGQDKLDLESNAFLIWLLGSAVHWESVPIPRMDKNGNVNIPKRQLSLPAHTEIMLDEYGVIVGWLAPDIESVHDPALPIFCAGITLWRHCGEMKREPYGGPVQGYEYKDEQCIDVIALQQSTKGSEMYHRVGRGRIVCASWLGTCQVMNITIC